MDKLFDTMSSSISQFGGMAELLSLLEMDDASFAEMEPYISKAVSDSVNTESFREEVRKWSMDNKGIDPNELKSALDALVREVEKTELSPAKKNFLIVLFSTIGSGITDFIIDFYDVEIKVQLLNDNAKIPVYTRPNDAGADIYVANDFKVPAHTFGMIIPTGLAMSIPSGWRLDIKPRSGLSAKTRLRISNTPGTIDTNYLDEIGIILDNFGDEYMIKQGDRLAQMTVEKRYRAKFTQVDNVKAISEDRGGGFGSSGR